MQAMYKKLLGINPITSTMAIAENGEVYLVDGLEKIILSLIDCPENRNRIIDELYQLSE